MNLCQKTRGQFFPCRARGKSRKVSERFFFPLKLKSTNQKSFKNHRFLWFMCILSSWINLRFPSRHSFKTLPNFSPLACNLLSLRVVSEVHVFFRWSPSNTSGIIKALLGLGAFSPPICSADDDSLQRANCSQRQRKHHRLFSSLCLGFSF